MFNYTENIAWLHRIKGTDASGVDDVEVDPEDSDDDDIEGMKKGSKRNVDGQAPVSYLSSRQ